MKKCLVFFLIIAFVIPLNTNAQIDFGGTITDKSVESESYYKYGDNFIKDEKELIFLVNYYRFLKDKTNKELFLQKIQIKKSYKTKYDSLMKSIDSKVSNMNNTDNMSKIVNTIDEKLSIKRISQNNKYILNYFKLSITVKRMDIFSKFPENILKEYYSQLKKARDTTRKVDISALESGIQQFYQDNSYYPNIDEIKNNIVGTYLSDLGKEKLGNVEINGCKFGYRYLLSDDKKNYKLLTCLENSNKVYTVSSNPDETINGNEIYLDGFTKWEKYDYSISNIKIENKQGSIFINGKNIEKTYDYNDWLDYYEKYEVETRDSIRYSHLLTLKSTLELDSVMNGKYPNSIQNIITKYNIKDPLDGQTINSCKFGYLYKQLNGGKNYIISTCVESEEYLKKAKNDGGYDDKKLEIGSNIKSLSN